MPTVSAGQSSGGLTVGSGSVLVVQNGGTVTNTSVISGGSVDLSGLASGTILSGFFLSSPNSSFVYPSPSNMFVSSGGSALATTVSAGGQLLVDAGSSTDTLVGGPGTYVSSGNTLSTRSEEFVSGGTASGTTVMSAGLQIVEAGQAIGTTVFAGGQEIVEAFAGTNGVTSGTVSNTTLSGGTLEVLSGGTLGGFVAFSAPGSELSVASGAIITAVLDGFVPGDSILLGSIPYSKGDTVSLTSGNLLEISETNGGQQTFQLDPAQNFSADTFALAALGNGTAVTDSTPCFCAGTLVLTDAGQVAVEHLRIGDMVMTMQGGARQIRWIGRRCYAGRMLAGRSHLLPIVFSPGSLGEGLPLRDLRVSPLHAMFLDGVLVPAGLLENGDTIQRDRSCTQVEYIHIELDEHCIIWAEGAPSETFLDDDSRGMFQNALEFDALYPEGKAAGSNRYCALRVESGFELEAIRQRLQPSGVLRAA